jgi:ATP synthase protein I
MNPKRGLWSAFALTTTIGFYIVAAIAVGVILGFVLDRFLGTRPWMAAAGTGLGFIAGLIGAYRLVMREMNK